MRGEYKVPGGKLVAVDLEVTDGRISHAAVSGDFFLEPDEALESIDGALLGMPDSASVAQLTQVVESVLGPEVVLVGFDAEAVAIAVRRALGHATRWEDHTFEIVHEGPQTPAMHMALDQAQATIATAEEQRDAALEARAAALAERAGLSVVMDRCVKIEHARFHGGLHLAGFDTGVISSKRQLLAR